MESETKVAYHGTTVVETSTSNQPPNSGYPPPNSGYPPPNSGYPPPNSGYPPPYAGNPPPGQPGPPGPIQFVGPPGTVIHTGTGATPTVIVAQPVGPQPTPMVCRSCHAEIVSRVEMKSSTKTHLFALGLFLCGCWCCICIPYCTDSCKNTNHYCPNCNAYIGEYKN